MGAAGPPKSSLTASTGRTGPLTERTAHSHEKSR
jgi:hypothetical protein